MLPRPRAFAAYMAVSASRSRISAVWLWLPKRRPMLAKAQTARSPMVTGRRNAFKARWATRRACSSVASGIKMANSSPPSRATVSVSRMTLVSRRATSTNTASPAPCPRLSLMVLNSSRSSSSTAEILLRDADTAMYAAKARGRGNIQVFQPAMHSTALARMQVATELGAGLAAGQLSLHYQPIVELATGEIIGAEALVRWLHPKRGQIIPAEFICVAEDTGLIVKIGHWGLRTAIGQLAAWARQFPLSPGFRLHVNLSPFEVRRPGLSEHIERTLEHHDVSPSRLTLEIAETGLMTGDTNGVETLLRLQALGISIEVDDFGTGHSSIS